MKLCINVKANLISAFLIIIFLLLPLTGCSHPPAKTAQEMQAEIITETALGPGDIIEVKFTYAPQFSEALTVRPDGKIQLQLVGDVTADGKTPEALREELMTLCKPYLQHPELAVITRKLYQARVYVGGEVKTPGQIDMPGRMTPLQAIMQAGGFDMRSANVKNVIIIRHKNGQRYGCALDCRNALEGKEEGPLFYLEPYDIVYVPRTTITKVNQWIDQYINKVVPETGFMYQYNWARQTIGIITDQPTGRERQ
jgi:Periplasmic protein involved in polysaccharide export